MAIQTIRPSADFKVDQWLHEGAGSTNLWQHIDDDPPVNTSFIAAQANWPGASYIATLANLGTPLTAPDATGKTQRIRYFQIFYTVASHTAGSPEGVYVTGRDAGTKGVPAHALGPRDSSWTKSTTFVTHKGFKRPSDPYIGELTEAFINRLQLEMYGVKSAFAKVGDAWVEVFVDNRPTVGTVTVVDPTTSTKPTITWVYADTEDDPQAAFQVKVFKTSDATAPGFSPDTTPAVWDSGLRYGSSETLSTGVSLLNGQSYTWYVRAAQLFNGQHWWSAWAASSSTTIAVTPPSPPTLTATKDETIPNLRTLLAATWVAGGGFTSGQIVMEYADLAAGVLNYATAQLATGGSARKDTRGFYRTQSADALVYDQKWALPGQEGAVRWSVNNAGSTLQMGAPSSFAELPPEFIPLKPGVSTLASVYAVADSSSFNSELIAQPVDATGASVGGSFTSGNIVIGTSGLARFQVAAFTAPATAVGVRLHLTNRSSVTGRTVYVTGVKVREGSGTESLDVEPAQGITPVWRAVRTADELSAITGSTVHVMDDEVVPGWLRCYRARSEVQVDTDTERSSLPTVLPCVYMTPAGSSQWVLKDPAGGLGNLLVRVLAGVKEEIVEEATDLSPLGREFGVTISDVIGGLDGSFIFRTEGEREWERLLAYLKAQRTLFLAYPSGGAKYVRLKERSIDRYGAPPNLVRRVEVSYKQRGRP